MLTRLAFSFALFASVGFLPGGASAAVMYTFGSPSATTGTVIGGASSTTLPIDLDGNGVNELNFFVDINTTIFGDEILTFQLSESGSAGNLRVAETASAASPTSIAALLFGGPIPTAQRLETVLGVAPVLDPTLNYDDSRGVLASNDLFADESDGQWSNTSTSAPVAGIFSVIFDRTEAGVTTTHLGFLQIEINEPAKTATILSFGFDDQDIMAVPEPSSSLLLLLSGSLLVLRRR